MPGLWSHVQACPKPGPAQEVRMPAREKVPLSILFLYRVPESARERSYSMALSCSLCGAVFKHALSLRYHLIKNVCTRPRRADPKQLKCPKCDKQFKGITAMDYHIKNKVCQQNNPRKRRTLSAGNKGIYAYHLPAYHVVIMMGVAGPPYSCEWCGTLFNMKQTCYVHMMRKACIRFPDKYALKSSFKNREPSLLENLEVTITEQDESPKEEETSNSALGGPEEEDDGEDAVEEYESKASQSQMQWMRQILQGHPQPENPPEAGLQETNELQVSGMRQIVQEKVATHQAFRAHS
ncbi:hypothetical protein D910_06815 [Dendroctonus ponderosae]